MNTGSLPILGSIAQRAPAAGQHGNITPAVGGRPIPGVLASRPTAAQPAARQNPRCPAGWFTSGDGHLTCANMHYARFAPTENRLHDTFSYRSPAEFEQDDKIKKVA